MRLELSSLDSGGVKSRLRRAILQIEAQKAINIERLIRESEGKARATIRVIDDAKRIKDGRAKGNWWGSFGAQIDTSKINGITGMIAAYDEVLEVLREVYNGPNSA